MKTISVIVPEAAVPSAIADVTHLFNAVNSFFEQDGKSHPFRLQLVGLKKKIELEEGRFSVKTDCLIKNVTNTDIIIIPAISGDIKSAIKANKDFFPWIIEQYKQGAEVASLCIGSFLLASTGLLRGKSCSTHWLFANQFREMFPGVNLVDDKIITDQNGIYTSGGATTLWNLLLYLVEKYTSRDIAILASKFFLLDIEKNSQAPFVIFNGQKKHKDESVIKAQEFMEENFKTRISVEELCDRLKVNKRTFERKFKKATNNSIVEYMQRVKVEAAKKQLETGRRTVNEVMYEVGYNDNKAFRDVFKKITGLSPINYYNKYNSAVIK